MPTWKLTLEYDGAPFCGWQRQLNGVAIQQVLEEALTELHGGEVTIATASGRTDAGVHARGQVVSFTVEAERPVTAYLRGLNSMLPDTIAVRAAELAPPGFDARRWARGKRYVYRILASRQRSPLRRLQTWQVYEPLDPDAIVLAARQLLGAHDFESFRAADCTALHARRELRRLDVTPTDGELVFSVEATAFVKHMVRNLVGTLVEVGTGRRAPDSMPALLAARDRTKAGRTAPPQGLRLDEVYYEAVPRAPAEVPDDDDAD